MCCIRAGAPRSLSGSPPGMKMGVVPNPGLRQTTKRPQEAGLAKDGRGGQGRKREGVGQGADSGVKAAGRQQRGLAV